MKLFRHAATLPTILLAGAISSWAGYQALAQRQPGRRAPIIATVQIEKLFEGLDERAVAKAEVETMEENIVIEQARRQAQIEEYESQIEDAVTPARRSELADSIAMERLTLQLWQQTATAELEVEKAVRLQNLYKSLKGAVDEIAVQEGYDMIVVNDAADELPYDREARVPYQLQVLQQITNRKLLYINNSIDITQDLVTKMNNQFRNPE